MVRWMPLMLALFPASDMAELQPATPETAPINARPAPSIILETR